jgi:hypothetical protein
MAPLRQHGKGNGSRKIQKRSKSRDIVADIIYYY